MTKRYAVFAGEEYYSAGGANNLLGWADTLEEAWELVDAFDLSNTDTKQIEWCHALDVQTGQTFGRTGHSSASHGRGIEYVTDIDPIVDDRITRAMEVVEAANLPDSWKYRVNDDVNAIEFSHDDLPGPVYLDTLRILRYPPRFIIIFLNKYLEAL